MVIAIAIVVFVQSLAASFVLGIWAYRHWQQKQVAQALGAVLPAAACLVTGFLETKNKQAGSSQLDSFKYETDHRIKAVVSEFTELFRKVDLLQQKSSEDLRSMVGQLHKELYDLKSKVK